MRSHERIAAATVNSEQARSALAEVDARRKQVRRSDRQLVWLLLIAAVAYLVAGIVVSTSPHQGTQLAGPSFSP